MGTQQILLIVLSVIIVGAAIAVGIEMFSAQSYSANKSALAADAQVYGTMVIQYYKTPVSLGGAGQKFSKDEGGNDANKIGSFIGWGLDDGVYNNGPNVIENENGKFILSLSDDDKTVIITAYGNEVRGDQRPVVVSKITFPEGLITAEVSDVSLDQVASGNSPSFNPLGD